MEADPPKRGPGRPKGSRNKPALFRPEPQQHTHHPHRDFKYADPDTMVARQLSLIDWAQKALRTEMQRGMQSSGVRIDAVDIQRIEKLSNSLVRAIEALKKVSDLAEEMQSRLTPQQLLDRAFQKIEGQDAATIKYGIKRLKAFLEKLGPTEAPTATSTSASSAISSLEDE